MSMNLHARTKKGEINLYQTPTWLTYAATIDHNGAVRYSVGNANAKRALHIYCQWAESLGGHDEDSREALREHVEYVKSRINDPGLEVYVL